jgi:phenylacetate-CoA ligase
MSRAELEALQLEKLRALLETAYAHSPWHRERMDEAGLQPDDVGDLAALRRLPLMDKAQAAANRDRLVWKGVPGGVFQYNTGGSSGQPLTFYFGRRRQAADAASRMRARRWWGIDVGSREVFLWGAPIELKRTDRIKTIRDRLFNQLLLNAFDMNADSMERYIEAIQAYRPAVLYGYASSVALLCTYARNRGRSLRVPSLRLVCTTGEPLYPDRRQQIAKAFGVPVASEFGSRDGGFIAHESPAGQMLQTADAVILEVLDSQGRPCPPGQPGEAVITNLYSDAQPFIRYRTGDVVTLSPDRCAEGRALPVLASVAGRTTDFVVRADGTVMHALSLIYVLRALPSINEFKIVQRAVDDLEVLVVAGPSWSERDAGQVVAGLQARLGHSARIDIQRVDTIPPEASGKHRYVVSHVPLPAETRFVKASD